MIFTIAINLISVFVASLLLIPLLSNIILSFCLLDNSNYHLNSEIL